MPFRSPQSPRLESFATVNIDYLGGSGEAGLDLAKLKAAFEAGARVFLFSIPNNPDRLCIFQTEIGEIARLAAAFDVTIIVDQLYSRLLYADQTHSHKRDRSSRLEVSVTRELLIPIERAEVFDFVAAQDVLRRL